MRILFLSQVLPYPIDAGPKMRSYYVLRHLSQKHEVTLLTFVRETDRPEDIAHLSEFCHDIHTVPMPRVWWYDARFAAQSLVTQQPFLIIRDHVLAMVNKLQHLAASESFDVIHADQLWMAQYALTAKAMLPSARLILDQHNAVQLIPKRLAENETNLLKRQMLNREARILTVYEPRVCDQFDHVVWVTEKDRQAVYANSSSTNGFFTNSTVIPICANPAQITPVQQAETRHRITFLGGLHWPPNTEGIVWFAKQVFPQVRDHIPHAVLTIIGKNPPAGLDNRGIEVTGYVPDPAPYLAETAAFIVPLHAGGGMRVKILDAWTWGLPIVSTTIGAEGIDTSPGTDILIADTPHAFAHAVIQVFQEPVLAKTLAQNGRQTVVDKYNWETTYTAWDKVYSQVLQRSRKGLGVHSESAYQA